MIYSFKISKDFFLNLQNKLDYNQSLSILNFFGELFLNRENLYILIIEKLFPMLI